MQSGAGAASMIERRGRAAPFWFALFILAAALGTRPAGAASLAAWVQFTEGGGLEARLVTDDPHCPEIAIDGRVSVMGERAAPDPAFPVRVCAAPLPPDARQAEVAGAALPPLPREPRRIVAFGDTGCRIKDMILPLAQDCNDKDAWPWPKIARLAASLKPDLVIHAGDYYYREDPCPRGKPGCAGSPFGDNWASWNADFFAPARPLLAAAPWVMVRGNHEDCRRGGHGWMRLLDPGPFDAASPCKEHDALYVARAGDLRFAVLDSAIAPDPNADPRLVPIYRDELAGLASLPGPVWLLTHRPFFGVLKRLLGVAIGGNATLDAALAGPLPPAVELLLSGHIHALQLANFATGAPPQLIVGDSGDTLMKTPSALDGLEVGGQLIAQGFSLEGFGFVLFERGAGGWETKINNADGKVLRRCRLAGRRFDCPSP